VSIIERKYQEAVDAIATAKIRMKELGSTVGNWQQVAQVEVAFRHLEEEVDDFGKYSLFVGQRPTSRKSGRK
jgi:hypothetical protein